MKHQMQSHRLLFIFILTALFLTGLSLVGSTYPPISNLSIPPLQITGTPIYLPLIYKSPECPLADYEKDWSGIHLGNRQADWNNHLLSCIDGGQGGTWPDSVVILSPQVYSTIRLPSSHPTHPCRISYVTTAPGRDKIFSYLKRASQAGVKIIIRIHPSPGNFVDWNDPAKSNHHLSVGSPVGPDGYCRPDLYRSKADVGDEMGKIHNFNVSQGFVEFGFESANEPNAEWYSFTSRPELFNDTAWAEMDTYFSAVYDWVHTYYSGVRVFTPPMAQGAYAESKLIADVFPAPNDPICQDVLLLPSKKTGYEMMRGTYETKNNGISWHNYWIKGKEFYTVCPWGQHVSLYFPLWMKTAISSQRPAIISEVDLASPMQGLGNSLQDKDANSSTTANSIRTFFSEERYSGENNYGVKPRIALWLLNDDNSNNVEHKWHEAYNGDNPRQWFKEWWSNSE